MSFAIHINGVSRNAFTRYRSLRIQKEGAMETAALEFLDQDISTLAFRPVDGDELHVTQDGGLEFGGEVASVKDLRLDGGKGGGTVTVVTARGWLFEADDIIVTVSFPSQPLYRTAEFLRANFLAAKGWTTNAPVDGGPILPALTYTRQTIRAIFDDLQKRSGYPYRVNGDRVYGFHVAGSLLAPMNLGDADRSAVLRGMAWTRDRVRYASRLLATTGGSGDTTYTEQFAGNGTVTNFPLTVFPKEDAPPTQVTEGGTVHTIGAGRWTYDANDARLIAASPVGAGVACSCSFAVSLPATVRVWELGTQIADGYWNYANIRDAAVQASEQTDIAQAKTWATAELNDRQGNPKKVTLSTFVQGFYPWQRCVLSFPDRLVTGPYLVQATTLTDLGRRDAKPQIDITLLEGDAIGRDWTRWFRERPAQGSGGGAVSSGGGETGGGGTGAAGLPPGTTFRIAGDNATAYAYPPATAPAPNNWRDAAQAVPTRLGGPGMAGAWELRVPAFILAAGTLTIRLLDQTTGTALATVATSKVAALLSGDFEFLAVNFTAPAAVHDLLLQAQSASGVLDGVIGQSTIVKL